MEKDFFVDVSHAKKRSFVFESAFRILKREGLLSLSKKIKKQIFYRYKGVDFSPENLYDLEVKGDKKNASTCNHILEKSFDEILKKLKEYDPLILNGAFTDYGSGKGFTLLKASQFGFKEVTGIEFAEKLSHISKNNLKKLSIKNAKTIHLDASLFIPPKNTRVIFFHNPFNETVFNKVLENIISVKNDFENELYLVYHYPLCEEVFRQRENDFEFLERFVSPTSKEITNFYRLI